MLRAISIIVFMVLLSRLCIVQGDSKPRVPCFFVFGDSLSDCGNNNKLMTRAKANFKPYGIDFPGGISTGRFTNGRTYVDFLSELLGFEDYIPAFNSQSSTQLAKGVNYASGAAGLLPDTGIRLGTRTCLASQIREHQSTLKKINGAKGDKVEMKKCLYLINIGSNDYINNYFGKGYNTSRSYTPMQYATHLIDQYRHDIKSLYDDGARKVALFGVGSIGCTPAVIDRFGLSKGSYCVDKVTSAAWFFNDQLVSLVDELNKSLSDAKFIYVNSTANPTTPEQGFKVFNETCCKPRGDDGLCKEGKPTCKNRSEYIFFDPYHPTQAVHVLLANMAFKANNSQQAYPMDISHLIMSS